MYGEDSCGRKVSLLNDLSSSNTIESSSTTPHPTNPNRSRPSRSSISSSASKEDYNSSRSSCTSSPRHSRTPPTPPLLRPDSQSSASRTPPSPMTPQYGFDSMDPHIKRESQQQQQQHHQNMAPPYYNNPYHPRNSNGYPSLHDPTHHPPYFHQAQQSLPPMPHDFGVDPSTNLYHSQRGTLQPLQTQLHNAATAYHENALAQLSPQAFHTQTPTSAHTNTNTTNTPITTLPPIPAATSTPLIKADPTTPAISTPTNPNNPQSATTPTTSNNKTPLAKKKYPCPHAQRYSCPDTFTTSGHAARHGKKHTGEKNILCPTCNKAFTRKDNMKQHERTHKGGSRSDSTAGSPVISTKSGVGGSSGSRKGSEASTDAMEVDIASPDTGSAGAGLGLPTVVGGVVPRRPKMARSELSEIMEGITKSTQAGGTGLVGPVEGELDADGEGESPGLDALATAASELA